MMPAARELFTAAGVEYYGDEVTMTEACTHMISRMQKILADRRPG